MDNPETQATMRTRHDTKTKKNPHHNKINNTVHIKTPEVIACVP